MDDEFDLEPYRVHNILHTYGDLDVKVAWDMEGEVIQLPFSDIEHVLHESAWEGQTPLEGAGDNPHWGLVLEADLDFPIIVIRNMNDGILEVVDGKHRVMKAWLLGEEFIAAKMVDHARLIELATIPSEIHERSLNVKDVLGH